MILHKKTSFSYFVVIKTRWLAVTQITDFDPKVPLIGQAAAALQ